MSSTEAALRIALSAAATAGARTALFDGAFLAGLPHYGTPEAAASDDANAFVEAVRGADGIILASPGYHGSVSGLVKNAIDYLEETSGDRRVYLDGLPVGLIATAYGWQAAAGTLTALRAIAHALRAWPTPYGAAICARPGLFEAGNCTDSSVSEQLCRVGEQVVRFARLGSDATQGIALRTGVS